MEMITQQCKSVNKAQKHEQSMEAEVLMDVANVKYNLLIHKMESHSCEGIRNMRAFGFDHAEQASCAP